jgi:hypothetical protein
MRVEGSDTVVQDGISKYELNSLCERLGYNDQELFYRMRVNDFVDVITVGLSDYYLVIEQVRK